MVNYTPVVVFVFPKTIM